jgi:hypothetical protein
MDFSVLDAGQRNNRSTYDRYDKSSWKQRTPAMTEEEQQAYLEEQWRE